jgi:hypothetical protein
LGSWHYSYHFVRAMEMKNKHQPVSQGAQRRIAAGCAGDEKRRLGLSAKAHGLLESAAYRRYVSISKGPWNAGSRPAAPFF